GVQGITAIITELNKTLDADPSNLPRCDMFALSSFVYDPRFQPFAQRLTSLEQRVKDVQMKLYICQDDIKDSNQQDQPDAEKQHMLESQFSSISHDIAVMAAEWQQGQLALGSALKLSAPATFASSTTPTTTATHTSDLPYSRSRSSLEDRVSRTTMVPTPDMMVDGAEESGDSGLGLDMAKRVLSNKRTSTATSISTSTSTSTMTTTTGRGSLPPSPSSPSSPNNNFMNRSERLHRRNLQVRHSVDMVRKSNEIWREYDAQQLLHQQQQPQRHLQLQRSMAGGLEENEVSHSINFPLPQPQPRVQPLVPRISSTRNSAVFEEEEVVLASSPTSNTVESIGSVLRDYIHEDVPYS
ncbi:hypothetical protein BGZ94_005505, partial [Podila epigama]